jgi:hypothetical protein
METVNKAMDDVRSQVEILSTVNSGLRGNENSAPKGSLIKMDATTDAIFKLQAKVDRLTEQVRHQEHGAVDPKTGESSITGVKELFGQMHELRVKINSMESALVSHQRYVVTESRLTLRTGHAVSDAKHHGRSCNGSQAKTGDDVLPADQGI